MIEVFVSKLHEMEKKLVDDKQDFATMKLDSLAEYRYMQGMLEGYQAALREFVDIKSKMIEEL